MHLPEQHHQQKGWGRWGDREYFAIKTNHPCTCVCYEDGVTASVQLCISHGTFTLGLSLTSYFQYSLGKRWQLTTIIQYTPLNTTVWKRSNPLNPYPLFPKTSHYVVSVPIRCCDKWERLRNDGLSDLQQEMDSKTLICWADNTGK